jgi:hypothetical protein
MNQKLLTKILYVSTIVIASGIVILSVSILMKRKKEK